MTLQQVNHHNHQGDDDTSSILSTQQVLIMKRRTRKASNATNMIDYPSYPKIHRRHRHCHIHLSNNPLFILLLGYNILFILHHQGKVQQQHQQHQVLKP